MAVDRMQRTIKNMVTNVDQTEEGLMFKRYDNSILLVDPGGGSGLEPIIDEEYVYFWSDTTMPHTVEVGTGLLPMSDLTDVDDSEGTPEWATVLTDPLRVQINELGLYQIYYNIQIDTTAGNAVDVFSGSLTVAGTLPGGTYFPSLDTQTPYCAGSGGSLWLYNHKSFVVPAGAVWMGPSTAGVDEYDISYVEFAMYRRGIFNA